MSSPISNRPVRFQIEVGDILLYSHDHQISSDPLPVCKTSVSRCSSSSDIFRGCICLAWVPSIRTLHTDFDLLNITSRLELFLAVSVIKQWIIVHQIITAGPCNWCTQPDFSGGFSGQYKRFLAVLISVQAVSSSDGISVLYKMFT